MPRVRGLGDASEDSGRMADSGEDEGVGSGIEAPDLLQPGDEDRDDEGAPEHDAHRPLRLLLDGDDDRWRG